MPEKLRIARIKFRAGSTPSAPALDVQVPNVTVLVGPNNSGKSQTLRDLETWCQGKDAHFLLIEEVDLILPDTLEDVRSMLAVHEASPPQGLLPLPGSFWIARPVIRQGEEAMHQQINEEQLSNWFIQQSAKNLNRLRQVFVRTFTLRLDGRTRFDLVDPKATGPLEERPQNHLWALFVDDAAREKVRRFTEEAFQKHFVIDPTGMTQFRVALAISDRSPRQKNKG
jgi:hypothetical protein